MKILPAILALLVVAALSVRGVETFNLLPAAGLAWVVAALLMAFSSRKNATPREALRSWAVFGLLWIAAASIVVTSWPLRIAPLVYRSQFEALADRVAAGQGLSEPEHIGPFKIKQGEVERGFVCLWLDLDPAGRSGFIRGMSGQKSTFNKSSLFAAGAGWQFLVED